jgi:hypothetical protein
MAALSATQPTATTVLQEAVAPPVNPEAMRRVGTMLMSKFTQYEGDRRLSEMKWLKNARQYLGVYDPDVEKTIPPNRSRAYPKITRVKCVSMLSRLMNLLFQVEEKNWTVRAPAVPDLSQQDLQAILDALMPPPAEGQEGMAEAPQVPSDEAIEAAVRKFADKRAERLELEIEDQLQELGGNKAQSYVALCRKVLASGIQYGAGVLRGPFVVEQKMHKWQVANGRLSAIPYMCKRPRFEFVSLWDYYPDMSAKTFAQMDGQFLRVVMSKHQVVKLMTRPDFKKDQIKEFLRTHPTGNYVRRQHETELKSLGAQINTSAAETNKYEALVWEGYVSGRELQLCGVRVSDDKLDDDVKATVWVMDGMVIKAELDPWSTLAPDSEMQQYHHFVFEEDESFLLGNALPNIMRDSQMGICAATRMTLDNASVQRVMEINTALLRMDVDVSVINPDTIIYRDDDSPATAQFPAVREVKFDTRIAEMSGIIKMFQEFADAETFVNPATGGDLQKGPSEPFRTAAGASMLRGDAALPFKDVVRNFDVFTESVIGALITFNRVLSTDPRLKGEFAAVARGATSLIAKEVQGAQLDNLAQTLTDEEKRYLKPLELLRARVRVRDMSATDVVMNDEEAAAADKQLSEQQQRAQEQQDQTVAANIRKVLSDALKNIAQAGKNSANAEATTANVILAALEKGLNPDMLASATAASPQGAPNGTAADTNPGARPAGPGQEQQPGTGIGGLEAATGNPLSDRRPQPAAMPAG